MLNKRATNKIIRDLKYLKFYIRTIKEYMHDSVDRELIDYIDDLIEYINKNIKEVK